MGVMGSSREPHEGILHVGVKQEYLPRTTRLKFSPAKETCYTVSIKDYYAPTDYMKGPTIHTSW